MNYTEYQYKILCEDKAHYHFVRGWLNNKSVKSRKITPYGELPHDGSGKEFVKNNFPDALKGIRSKATKTILIVVTDADHEPVENVIQKFSYEKNDFVFFVIPKWSIETWLRFLENCSDATICDESKSYKKSSSSKKYASCGKQLATINIEDYHGFIPKSLQTTHNKIKKRKSELSI